MWRRCSPGVVALLAVVHLGCVSTHSKAPKPDAADDAAADAAADRPTGDAADTPADAPSDARADLAPPGEGGRANGEACGGSAECKSGVCADGVCCATACAETCRACNVPNNVGTCMTVPLSAPARAGECPPNAANKCGNTGLCDGAGKCQLAAATVPCGAASCDPVTNLVSAAPRCDGKGACQPETGVSCAPARCNAARTGCATPCTSNDECLPPNLCVSSSCGQAANGLACTSGAQCKSGSCVDGLCCDSACNGQCEACDLGGSLGVCKPATGAPHGARPACGGDAACPGTCDGATRARCAYPANRCRSQACSLTAVEVIKEAFCDGNGVCPGVATMPCTYACRAGACTTCAPGTRRCNGASPQICDADGNWQNVPCASAGNMLPACNPDGTCGHVCQSAGGTTPTPLTCASGNVCPVWAFEAGGTDGWTASGSALNGAVTAGAKVLAGNTTRMLIAPVLFNSTRGEVVFQLRLCTAGMPISGKSFSYRIYPEGPAGAFLTVFPRAVNGADVDTPNGLSAAANQWTTDPEGFFQASTVDLQIVVRYNGDWQGTLYLDDIVLN